MVSYNSTNIFHGSTPRSASTFTMASRRIHAALPLPESLWTVAKFAGVGYAFFSLVGQFIQVITTCCTSTYSACLMTLLVAVPRAFDASNIQRHWGCSLC